MPEGKTFLDNLNPHSLEVLRGAQAEPSLASAVARARASSSSGSATSAWIPIPRPGALVFNRTVSLRDTWARIAQKVRSGFSAILCGTRRSAENRDPTPSFFDARRAAIVSAAAVAIAIAVGTRPRAVADQEGSRGSRSVQGQHAHGIRSTATATAPLTTW